MTTHSSFHAWRIPWTEEPGGLRSTELQSQTQLKLLSTHDPITIFLIALGLFCVGLFLLLYLLPREVPLYLL